MTGVKKIQSPAQFRSVLGGVLPDIDVVAAEYPEPAIVSIQKQLHALELWTRDDRAPTQAEKDDLNFGLLSSRNLTDLDPDLAQRVVRLASWVTYW